MTTQEKMRRLLAQRETKRAAVEIGSVQLDGTFSGYASLFNQVDMGNDAVAAGAFRASLAGRDPASVKMLYQHDPNEPIGVWHHIEEDEKGLYVEGRITKGVSRGGEIVELMRSGALDGLSIGFKTKRARVDANTKVRWILEADLWEISVVTFPLLEDARIRTVKSGGGRRQTPTTREFERWLTRDAGLSRREARQVIAGGFHALTRKRDAAGLPANDLVSVIRQATRTICE